MSAIEREARRDAKEFARAQMFYGEGAGIRRKLISAKVESKAGRNEAYARAFHQELAHQDMAEHAAKASRERAFRDRSNVASKNFRALATGNYQNVSTGILVVAAGGYLLHQTGLDQKIYLKTKRMVDKVRNRRRKNDVVHNITTKK